MRTDTYGQIIYNEADLCGLLLQDPDRVLHDVLMDRPIVFNDSLTLTNIPKLKKYEDSDASLEKFDEVAQSDWYMPKEYYDLDIAKWVLDQCKNEETLQRAGAELLEYHARNMLPLLQYLKYLVDIMREHNVIWGVGRGSSVSSYVLFLIGIHKIDSLFYGLSIDEFLK